MAADGDEAVAVRTRGNPFWSERAADEWLLTQLRPQTLPETPSAVLPPVPPDQPNEWDERTEEDSPRPVKDQQRKGSPQVMLSEKRSGRGSASSSAFRIRHHVAGNYKIRIGSQGHKGPRRKRK